MESSGAWSPRIGVRGRLEGSRLRRGLYVVAGLVCVGLGAIGVVLPGVPATPFLLLASAAFMRSDPRLHAWLSNVPAFGPLIRDWERTGAISRRVRRTALLMIPIVIAASVVIGKLPWPAATAVVVLGGIGWGVVLRLPVK